MTEPAKAPDGARLDELAAVTKAYARYSGPSSGLATSATGAWLLTAEWALRGAPRAGEVLFALAPVVWIALASRARSYYQRHGKVVAAEEDLEGGGPVRAIMLAAIVAWAAFGIIEQFEGPPRGWEIFVVATCVTIPLLASRLSRSTTHLGTTFALTMLAGKVQGGAIRSPWFAEFRLGFGLLMLVIGIVSHLRYRRLERRLAALKGRA